MNFVIIKMTPLKNDGEMTKDFNNFLEFLIIENKVVFARKYSKYTY